MRVFSRLSPFLSMLFSLLTAPYIKFEGEESLVYFLFIISLFGLCVGEPKEDKIIFLVRSSLSATRSVCRCFGPTSCSLFLCVWHFVPLPTEVNLTKERPFIHKRPMYSWYKDNGDILVQYADSYSF